MDALARHQVAQVDDPPLVKALAISPRYPVEPGTHWHDCRRRQVAGHPPTSLGPGRHGGLGDFEAGVRVLAAEPVQALEEPGDWIPAETVVDIVDAPVADQADTSSRLGR